MTNPSKEPAAVYAGDTWAWTRILPDYPASAGWTLKYALTSAAGKLAFSATPSGADYSINVAAATTQPLPTGTYTWRAFVEKGAERYTVGTGTLDVLAGIDGTALVDARSAARQALDAAESALKTYTETNGAVSEYEINGRRVKYSSVQQLRELVAYWRQEVHKENVREQRRRGKSMAGRVITRFGR